MAVIRRDIASGWREFSASLSSFDKWCGGRREKKSKVDISPPASALVTREPPAPEPLKYAYFDAHNDDALPIMPTLEDTKHVAVEVKVEEHELTPMKGAGAERSLTPAAQGLEREVRVPSPLQALRQADKRARTPAGGYGRDAYGDRSAAFGAPSPTSAYSSPAPPPVGAGYPEGGVHQQGRRREQYAGHNTGHNDHHLQQPQPQWGDGAYRNTVQNAYGAYEANPYQAPRRPRQQQHQQLQPAQDTYYDQRKQPQEWTLV
ncbi:unnamed protein product [Tuber aestivum]|uniref:Uncharacterized protein n=1 Tax=Tuber aestivum TaxID=59557 RepID=A0A292PZY3_9PEZI|nr:unnamed protein product [Tuber aestivum]